METQFETSIDSFNTTKRITSLQQFQNLKNKSVWIVTVPKYSLLNETKIVGNSFINEWVVDDIYSQVGNKITNLTVIEDAVYTPHGTKSQIIDGEKFRYLISLNDYNLLPENQSNTDLNAIFYDFETATQYSIWLALQYGVDQLMNEIQQNTSYGKLVNWNSFIKHGLCLEEFE